MFPLKAYRSKIPAAPDAAFGKVRIEDIHTGVDLYAPEGTPVYAVEDGIVVAVEDFTGVETSGPDEKYLYTQAALVKGGSGVIVYGEIIPSVKEGQEVKEGDIIGRVTSVLPESYDGPSSMLHFELYDTSAKATAWWMKGERRPEKLLDPTRLLRKLKQSRPAQELKRKSEPCKLRIVGRERAV